MGGFGVVATVRCGCGICRVRQSRELGRHGSWVSSVALTSDGRWAVSGSARRCGAALGSAGSGEPRAGPARWLGQFGGVDVGWPVGGFGVGRRCGAAVGSAGSGEPRAGPARERVRSVALTSDGRWAVSGSSDGAVRLWDLQGQASRELGRHGRLGQVGGVDVGWPVGGFGVERRYGAAVGSAGSGAAGVSWAGTWDRGQVGGV